MGSVEWAKLVELQIALSIQGHPVFGAQDLEDEFVLLDSDSLREVLALGVNFLDGPFASQRVKVIGALGNRTEQGGSDSEAEE
jgi:hypothetical protein